LDVLVVDDYLKADDLATDPRWPKFGERAVQACGIRSMISYRLYLGRHRGAVLSFYSTWPHAFDLSRRRSGPFLPPTVRWR
jgi:hypothetical protein